MVYGRIIRSIAPAVSCQVRQVQKKKARAQGIGLEEHEQVLRHVHKRIMHAHKLELQFPVPHLGPTERRRELLDEQPEPAHGPRTERYERDRASGDRRGVERAREMLERPRVRPRELLPRGVVRE